MGHSPECPGKIIAGLSPGAIVYIRAHSAQGEPLASWPSYCLRPCVGRVYNCVYVLGNSQCIHL